MAPHSSTLAWKIPWTEEPGRLQSTGSLRVRNDLSDFTFTFHFHALEKEMATHSSVLAWIIPGMGEPGGLPSMGSHRVGHDWSDLVAVAAACWGRFLYAHFLKCFYHKWVLNFVEGFFCIYSDKHVVFTFQFVNMVYHIDWYGNTEESLYPWNKVHLVMMYNLFMVLENPHL